MDDSNADFASRELSLAIANPKLIVIQVTKDGHSNLPPHSNQKYDAFWLGCCSPTINIPKALLFVFTIAKANLGNLSSATPIAHENTHVLEPFE